MPRSSVRQRAFALGLIPGLVLALFGLAGCGVSTTAHTAAPTATTPPVATATHAAVPNYPLVGWQIGGPTFATAIAFASGSSGVAYACGANGEETSPGIHSIAVAFSADNARTWTTETTPGRSVLCTLTVDPTNAQDVVLFTTTCATGCTSDPVTHLYRSRDQGRTWSELAIPALPAAPGAGASAFTSMLAWSGTTLIAETEASIPNGHPVQHLVASINAGPFVRVDQSPLFSNVGIGKVFSVGTAVYVAIFPSGCTGTYFCSLAKTSDGGTNWRQVSLRYQSQTVDLLAAAGTALIVGTPSGAIQHAQIARTGDDGQSWQTLPTGPAGMEYFATDDGTLFLTDLNSGALYRLAPGAQQWQLAVAVSSVDGSTPTTLDDGSLVFQCDGSGHPVAVWRDAAADQGSAPGQYPGLQFHAL